MGCNPTVPVGRRSAKGGPAQTSVRRTPGRRDRSAGRLFRNGGFGQPPQGRRVRLCSLQMFLLTSRRDLHLVTGGRLRAGVAVRHGVFTPYTESNKCLIVALDSWRAIEGKCIPENRARVRPEFGIQHETKVDQVVTTICRGVAQTPEARCAGELAFGA